MSATADRPGVRRFVVEISPGAPDGRITGTVRPADSGDAVAFSGWLDLLRLLEPVPADPVPGP